MQQRRKAKGSASGARQIGAADGREIGLYRRDRVGNLGRCKSLAHGVESYDMIVRERRVGRVLQHLDVAGSLNRRRGVGCDLHAVYVNLPCRGATPYRSENADAIRIRCNNIGEVIYPILELIGAGTGIGKDRTAVGAKCRTTGLQVVSMEDHRGPRIL